MGTTRRHLIHPRTRDAFREHCSDCGTVNLIARTFGNEGLEPEPSSEEWDAGGQRRGTFDRFTANVDWANPLDVRKVLNAFEEVLRWGEGDWAEKQRATLVRLLRKDGYSVDGDGRIRSGAAARVAEIPLETLTDPSAILEHLDRITETMDTDPPLAISGAKALVEATTKVVLVESLAPTAAGVEIVKRILSNLSQIAIGLAELRNEYGPDHGRSRPVVGLGPRHAHSAVRPPIAVFSWRRWKCVVRRKQPRSASSQRRRVPRAASRHASLAGRRSPIAVPAGVPKPTRRRMPSQRAARPRSHVVLEPAFGGSPTA